MGWRRLLTTYFKWINMRVAVVGATGMVGTELLSVLENVNFPIGELKLYASERSSGKILKTYLGDITIENADDVDYNDLDIAFFPFTWEFFYIWLKYLMTWERTILQRY